MPKTIITAEIELFIKANCQTQTSKEIADHFSIDKGPVQRYRKNFSLQLPAKLSREKASAKLRGKTKISPEQDMFIKENYLKYPVKTLANLMNIGDTALMGRLKNLCLVIPAEVIEKRKRDSRIKRGHVPVNKGLKQVDYMSPEAIARTEATRFKKGGLPPNTLYPGKITIRNDHGRLSKWLCLETGKWIELQRNNWLQAGNEIPAGFILAFKDGNSLNCEPYNLELISRAQNLARNRNHVKALETYKLTKFSGKVVSEVLKKNERIVKVRKAVPIQRKIQRRVDREEVKRANAQKLAIHRENFKIEKQAEANQRRQQVKVAKARKEQRRIEQALATRNVLPTRIIDTTQLIPLRIDSKTVVYIKPGADPEQVKLRFLNRNIGKDSISL